MKLDSVLLVLICYTATHWVFVTQVYIFLSMITVKALFLIILFAGFLGRGESFQHPLLTRDYLPPFFFLVPKEELQSNCSDNRELTQFL